MMRDTSTRLLRLKKFYVILLLLFPCVTIATVYKSVDSQGNITYSDQPAPGAQTVNLPAVQTYQPSLQPLNIQVNLPQGLQNKSVYRSLSIISPTNNEPIRQNEGIIIIQTNIDPPLREGDKLILMLDNTPTGAPQVSPTFVITNVDRGTHTAQVQVVDSRGNILFQSLPVTFHLLRYHIKRFLQTNSAITPPPLPLSNDQIQTLQQLEKSLGNSSAQAPQVQNSSLQTIQNRLTPIPNNSPQNNPAKK